MNLRVHPQYQQYLARWQLAKQLQQAISQWRTQQGTISTTPKIAQGELRLEWSLSRAVSLAREVGHIIEQLNDRIWQDFPYCRECGGQCCRGNTPEFDDASSLLLLLLLERPVPTLPDHIDAHLDDCIYRTSTGCLWNPVGRPLPCALYFCLGGPTSEIDPSWEAYQQMSTALGQPFLDQLSETVLGPVFSNLVVSYPGDPALFTDPGEVAAILRNTVYDGLLAGINARFLSLKKACPS